MKLSRLACLLVGFAAAYCAALSCTASHRLPQQSLSAQGEEAPVASKPLAEILLLVDDVGGLGLFYDEAAVAKEQVAAWARSQGLHVVDVARTEQVFARARAGKHAETGDACGLPLPDWRAEQRWQGLLGAEGKLRSDVRCDDEGCALYVSASDRVGYDGETLARYRADFDPGQDWGPALEHALKSLAPPPADDDGGGGLMGVLGGLGSKVREPRPESMRWNAWPARAADGRDKRGGGQDGREALSRVLPTSKDEARACFGDSGGTAEFLLDVDDAGKVKRCESRNGETPSALCLCPLLLRHAVIDDSLRGLRIYASLSRSVAELETPDGYVVSASTRTILQSFRNRKGELRFRALVSDPSIAEWAPPRSSLIERCFAGVHGGREIEARVRVTFDARGEVDDVEVKRGEAGILSAKQKTCLERAFEKSRAPCPAAADHVAEATARVAFAPTPRAPRTP